MAPSKPKILYVLGTSFSGSSLLNAMFDGHPDVLALNELANLGAELRDTKHRNPRHPLFQPFWQEVKLAYEEGGRRFEDVDASWTWRDAVFGGRAAQERWSTTNDRVLSAIIRVSGPKLLVDTSKGGRRLDRLIRDGYPVWVVHLVRDGRSVVGSGHKRGVGVRQIMRRLTADLIRGEYFRRRLGPQAFRRVRYDDLARDPEGVLKGICAFVGLEYHPAMVDLDEARPHPPAIGAKGYWMAARSQALRPPSGSATLPARDEVVYRALGGPVRDRILGVGD